MISQLRDTPKMALGHSNALWNNCWSNYLIEKHRLKTTGQIHTNTQTCAITSVAQAWTQSHWAKRTASTRFSVQRVSHASLFGIRITTEEKKKTDAMVLTTAIVAIDKTTKSLSSPEMRLFRSDIFIQRYCTLRRLFYRNFWFFYSRIFSKEISIIKCFSFYAQTSHVVASQTYRKETTKKTQLSCSSIDFNRLIYLTIHS